MSLGVAYYDLRQNPALCKNAKLSAHPLWLIFRLAQEFAHMTKSHYNMGSKAGEGALGASTDFVSLLPKLKVMVGESET